MVVKPHSFIASGRKGMAQPAVKCRGAEYLRIIYGPEYDTPEHLERLRRRGLGRKRSLAIREFLLGAEALQRFVALGLFWPREALTNRRCLRYRREGLGNGIVRQRRRAITFELRG
jgi:hypothetical protein